MSDETEARAMFRSATAPAAGLDVAAVIRRSKRRRLPQRLGAGGVMTLALAAIGVAGVTGISGLRGTTTAISDTMEVRSEQAPMSAAEEQSDSGSTSSSSTPESCGRPAPPVTANPWQLVAEMSTIHTPTADSGDLTFTVLLNNPAAEAVAGRLTGAIEVTISQNGAVVAAGVTDPLNSAIQLAPGESLRLEGTVTPVLCQPDADQPELGELSPGKYLVAAELEFTANNKISATVSGSAATMSIR